MTRSEAGARTYPAARMPRTVDWLHLAAAPTFAAMGLLCGIGDRGPVGMLCGAVHGAWPLGGMATMYLLMAFFHAAPWIELVGASRRHLGGVARQGRATRSSHRVVE